MAGYLFVHFTGEQQYGEQIYFSISRDGLHWKDLNGHRPVLYSDIGEKGARDPFCVRDEKNGKFYLFATDLRIEEGKGWETAIFRGSRDMIVWESEDLVHWSEARAVTVGRENAGSVWAPEAVYVPEKEAFLVFWASHINTPDGKGGKFQIDCAWTKDFVDFTAPEKFMEREKDVIDTTMIQAEGRWYRFTMNDVTKRVCMEWASDPKGPYEEIKSETLTKLSGVEGPEIYRLPDGRYCLIADRFMTDGGYLPLVSADLAGGKFEILTESAYDMGSTKKRHGGILPITDEEYERLEKNFDRINPILPGLFADPDIAVFDGKYYIYPTSDGYDNWSGNRFYIFSSEDGIHFKKGPLLLDVATEQVSWATGYAWAPCIARKGDTWYFYFCAKDQNGESCIGMAWAKHPEGPFTACEKPFITMPLAREWGLKMGYGGQTIDPSIYQEGEEFYLLFGNGHPAIGKLNEKMDGLVPGTIQNLEGLFDFREAVSVKKRGGLYHFTWSCDDTGSEDYHINYGTSRELYGPVEYQYAILTKEAERDIYGTGHHSIVQLPGSDCWKIAYHRFGTPTERYPEGKGFHRETCIADLTFDENGLMEKVKMWD